MGDLQVMSASMDSDPDIALFLEDLVILKREVASLIEHLKGGATNNVQNATNQVERHVRSLRQEAGAQAERSAQAISVFTEKQPLVALIIAVGDWLCGRSRASAVSQLNHRPSRLFLSVRRLAWRAAIDWTFRAYRDPPTVRSSVPGNCAQKRFSESRRRRFGSTSFESVAAA
jgi:hypothetical protein